MANWVCRSDNTDVIPLEVGLTEFSRIESELFVACRHDEADRRWTLASRLGDMLTKAEKRFGPRDMSYTFLGIEFAGNIPMIRYHGEGKQIIIQLSLDALVDLPRACYQLGHECIHLLAPTGKQNAINLEEGLATLFGEDYATKWFDMPRDCGGIEYERAKKITDKAFRMNPNFVREIRLKKPSFCDFTPKDILKHSDILPEEADFLCQPFYSAAVG